MYSWSLGVLSSWDMIQPNGSPNNECLEKFTEFQNPGIFVTMMGQ